MNIQVDAEYAFHALNCFPELRTSIVDLEAREKLSSAPKCRTRSRLEDLHQSDIAHSASYKIRMLKKSSLEEITPHLSAIRSKLRQARSLLKSNKIYESFRTFESKNLGNISNISSQLSPGSQNSTVSLTAIQHKLANCACTYDFSSNNINYKLFQDVAPTMHMEFDEFDLTLKQVFDIWLSKSESKVLYDSLITHFDKTQRKEGSRMSQLRHGASTNGPSHEFGKVHAQDLIKYFRNLRFEEKQRRTIEKASPIRQTNIRKSRGVISPRELKLYENTLGQSAGKLLSPIL